MVKRRLSQKSIGVSTPSEEFLDQTIEVWQPYSKRALTREDAREITANVTGFFQVLMQWKREEEAQLVSAKQVQSRTTEPKASKKRPSS